jgi:hypothetical protein
MTAVFRANVLVLAVLGLSACGVVGRSDLNTARGRWGANAPDRYSYTLRWGCFCPADYVRPTRITVRDGEITNVVDAETGAVVEKSARNAVTIEELFEKLDEAYARNAERVDVAYDPTYGHPASVSIDYKRTIADEELGWTATDLQVAP